VANDGRKRVPPTAVLILALLPFLHSCGTVIARSGGRPPIPRGISAWTYDYGGARVEQVKAHNASAPEHRKFRYLFPYAGSVSFGPGRTFTTSWDGETTARYVAALGKGIWMLPIFDGRQDKDEFSGWTETEYGALAEKVAAHILADPNARGVQVDIEPFRDAHLPFYEALGKRLRAGGKLMTGFISPGRSEQVLRRMYAACDIVVLAGYDFELPNPAAYGNALDNHLAKCNRIAAETGGVTMVGIPAAAAWAEHEYTGEVVDGACKRRETGYTQEQWLGAAVSAVGKHEDDPAQVGVALWVLTGRTRGEPGECLPSYQPDFISSECWKLVRTMGR
jgi:hypothetical protein